MGYSLSWLAVRNKTIDILLNELSLKRTGIISDYPESLISGRPIPGGWFIVVFDDIDHPLISKSSLKAISKNCEAIACTVEEHVMMAASELWTNGEQIWRIEHDAQTSIEHINASGRLPADYLVIARDCKNQQDGAGGKNGDTDYYFEIPLQVAKNIVGFKHDETTFEDAGFEELHAANAKVKPTPITIRPPLIQDTPKAKLLKNKPWWNIW